MLLGQVGDIELLGEGLYSCVGDFVVVHEPVEAFGGGCDVVGHDFAEALVVGDDEEVDQDDVAESEAVDEVGHAHLAEGVEDDEGGAGVAPQVEVHLLQEDARVFHLRHREEHQLDGVGGGVRLEAAVEVVDAEDLHLGGVEVLEGDELAEEGLEDLSGVKRTLMNWLR